MTTRQDQLDKFVKAIRVTQSVNFPKLAKDVGLSFTSDILPALRGTGPLRAQVQEVLIEIKYELLNHSLEMAKAGKSKYGTSPDAAAIKAMIGHIDSGVLLGGDSEDHANGADISNHLDRLGLATKVQS